MSESTREVWFLLEDELRFEAFKRAVEVRHFARDVHVTRHGSEACVRVHDQFSDSELADIGATYDAYVNREFLA